MKNADFSTDMNLERLAAWGAAEVRVRAMLLTSTRAVPAGAAVAAAADVFSDYDVVLALTDVRPFHARRDWLETFGPLLALYRDPLEGEPGLETSGYVVQYENGLKIDFTLWPVEVLRRTAANPQLPAEYDAGYRVLLDKDGLTAGMKAPTYQGYIPLKPTRAEFEESVEVFFVDSIYVAKYLWRDDLVAAKHVLENFAMQEHIRPMLEWRIEIDHGWAVKPGPYGRGLKRWLRPDLFHRLEQTYTGPGIEESWQALFAALELMRCVGCEVAEALGYAYPEALHERALAYIHKVKALPPGAQVF